MHDGEFTPHHLGLAREHVAGNDGAGRFFFLPGSDGRAKRIADRFTDVEVVPSDRALNAYLGSLVGDDGRRVDVGAVATGMGCPSVDIVASELILLGARLLLRVGTAGSLAPAHVRAGSLVIATGAVRDEGTSDAYVSRDYPAIADPALVRALERAARAGGVADHTFAGLVHSKDSLFGREFGAGPAREQNAAYMASLRALPVLATEMEAAHLFVLADVHSGTAATPLADTSPPTNRVRAGTLLAVIGDDQPFADPAVITRAETEAVDLATAAAVVYFAE